MASLRLVLMVFAFVFSVLATIGINTQPPPAPIWRRLDLLAAAIAFWIAATLFG